MIDSIELKKFKVTIKDVDNLLVYEKWFGDYDIAMEYYRRFTQDFKINMFDSSVNKIIHHENPYNGMTKDEQDSLNFIWS